MNGIEESWIMSRPKTKRTDESYFFIFDKSTGKNYDYDKFNEKLFLLTYSYLIEFNETGDSLVQSHEYTFNEFTQKEALVVFSEKLIVVAAESHPLLGGPFLHLITKK